MQLNVKCDSIRGSPVHYNLVVSDSDGETLYSTDVDLNECKETICSVTIQTVEFSASLSVELTLATVNTVDTSLYLPKPQICELTLIVFLYKFESFFMYRSNKCLVLSTSTYIN